MPRAPYWLADHIASLHEFVNAGLSGSETAVKLNERHGTAFSRNAVIGRVHRMAMLKLVGKPKGRKRKGGTMKDTEPPPPPERKLTVQEALRHFDGLSDELHWVARHGDFFGVALPPDDQECHFVHGDPKLRNHFYCRHPVLKLGPDTWSQYCPYHSALTHRDSRGYRDLADLLGLE